MPFTFITPQDHMPGFNFHYMDMDVGTLFALTTQITRK